MFLRERPGFDCILGNPPWETVKAEEHKFWGLRHPGLRGLNTGAMNIEIERLRAERPDLVAEFERQRAADDGLRRVILAGPFRGLGSGDPDLSEVFAWRFSQLVAQDGTFGVVLPRSVFMSAGTDEWRLDLFRQGQVLELLTLVNTGGWVFDDAEPRYTIALVSYQRRRPKEPTLLIRGPYRAAANYVAGRSGPGATLAVNDLIRWTPGAGVPLLPSERSAEVYRRMRSHPSLVSSEQPWTVRSYNELHATADKIENGGVIDTHTDERDNLWPVYKGESFGLWNPWTGVAYGWAEPEAAVARLQTKRLRQVRTSGGPFFGMSMEWARDAATLPCLNPRVAWRMVARATDTRSFYAVLLPPKVLSAHHNYCLFFGEGEHARDEAYVLGIMCSIPFDWHARLWVEANFTASIVKPFPVPSVLTADPMRRRVEVISARLAAPDARYKAWASSVGVDAGNCSRP